MSDFFRQDLDPGNLTYRAAARAMELLIEDLKKHASQKRGPKRFTPDEVASSRSRVLDSWAW